MELALVKLASLADPRLPRRLSLEYTLDENLLQQA
jgi:hypothetical protein